MRVSFLRASCLAAAFGFFAASSATAIEPAPAPYRPGESPWIPWFQLGLIGSNDLNRAEGELFLPNGNDTTLAFLDIRGNFFTEDFDDKEIEGNFSLGLRHMLEQGWNLGLWVGGDVREVESDNTFWQVSTGLEALHDNWDFRFNGYAPITGPKTAPAGSANVKISGNSIFMTGETKCPSSATTAKWARASPSTRSASTATASKCACTPAASTISTTTPIDRSPARARACREPSST
jgi:hypothetical protein